jgi:hypothetical protein
MRLKTVSCFEYVNYADAILMLVTYSGISSGEITFSGGSKCHVDRGHQKIKRRALASSTPRADSPASTVPSVRLDAMGLKGTHSRGGSSVSRREHIKNIAVSLSSFLSLNQQIE